jgi:hypothetical protein
MQNDVMRSQLLGSLRLRGDNASSSRYALEYFPVFPAKTAVAQTCDLHTNYNSTYSAGNQYSQMLLKSHKDCPLCAFTHSHTSYKKKDIFYNVKLILLTQYTILHLLPVCSEHHRKRITAEKCVIRACNRSELSMVRNP